MRAPPRRGLRRGLLAAAAAGLIVAALAVSASSGAPASAAVAPDGATALDALDAADAAREAACDASLRWRALLDAYALAHARDLALLEAGAAAVAAAAAPRPLLSVYIVKARESLVGFGDIAAGLSNVFLSALRRGRVLLVDWEGSEAALGPPRGLDTRTTLPRWQRLAAALGTPGYRSEAHWRVDGAGDIVGNESTWPDLWGRAGRGRGRALETHTHYNRGAFTPDGGALPGSRARRWLDDLLPRAADGTRAYGCVYRAAFSITRQLRARAAKLVPLPPPRPAGEPPALVCAHVRTWHFSGPPQGPEMRDAFRCVEHVLSTRGDAATALFLATDNSEARAVAIAHFGGSRAVLAAPIEPDHIAYKQAASDEEIRGALESSVADWWRLSTCEVVVLAVNTGFSRTAAAAAQASLWFVRTEHDVAASRDGLACVEFAGPRREVNKDVGCGW